MAQATITHFVERSPEELRVWAGATEQAVADYLYDHAVPRFGDVTVRTLKLEPEGSRSSALTEIHLEIAAGDWPKHRNGDRDEDPESASRVLGEWARVIGGEILSIAKPELNNGRPKRNVPFRELNVWATPYLASGWAQLNVGKIMPPNKPE